jgi:hypothetical protein
VTAALEWTPADGSLIVVPDRRKHPCSRCGGPRNVPGQAYCRNCHAASMREQRAKARAELAEMRRLLHVAEGVDRETYPSRPETVSGTETRQIELGGGLFAVVDAEDYAWLRQWKWRISGRGYAVRVGAGKPVAMHREILQTPEGVETDHIDRNRTNNVRANLRAATRSQNTANSNRSDRESEYKGVSWHRQAGRWRATASTSGKQVYIGLFDDPADAARAYDKKARELYGEFAYLNFPQEVTT